MNRLALVAVAVSITASLGGCTLDWGGDDDVCDVPAADQGGFRAQAVLELVDPSNLTCQIFSQGGSCNVCGCDQEADAVPIPSWGLCTSNCTGLDETTCAQATGCRMAYDRNCYLTDGICPLLTPYLGCFATDMTGPIQGGACDALDATECSRHDDCIALHSPTCDAGGANCVNNFVQCVNESPPPP